MWLGSTRESNLHLPITKSILKHYTTDFIKWKNDTYIANPCTISRVYAGSDEHLRKSISWPKDDSFSP